jgi:ATP/maltotriose-dependent transcriptional regulator MalT
MSASLSRLLFVATLVPLFLAGCGTKSAKKGGGMTVQQRLEKAEKESTPDKQAAGYLRAARAQLASGDTTGARDSARTAFDRLKSQGDANTFAPRLVDAAAFLAEIGDKKAAKDAILLASERSSGIADAVRRTKILADAGAVAGEKLKGIGDALLAKDLLTQASAMADTAEERFRAEALAAVALGCTRAGQAETAAALVDRLEESAKALEEPRAKAEALAAAANVRAETGKKDEATALLTEAAAAAKSIERAEGRAYALLAVANATAACGDKKQALALLQEADKAANKVADPAQQKTTMDKVRTAIAELEK